MAERTIVKRKTSASFPKLCEYGCGKIFEKHGNNESNYKKHLIHCVYRPKKVKTNLYNFFSKNVGTSHEEETPLLSTQNNEQDGCVPSDAELDLGTDVIDEGSNSSTSLESLRKLCKGFTIQFENEESFYRIYPFHRHASEDSTLQFKYHISINYDEVSKKETLVIHSPACTRVLEDPSSEVNKCCLDMEYTQQFRKMLEMSSATEIHEFNKLEMHNFQQLQIKYHNLKALLNEEKLQNLNLLRRNSILNQRCTLNARFTELIASADIPRLKVLLQICYQKGMGMKSILGRIEDAINKKYSPKKYGDVDWEKAILVLRIGGPRLLHALHVSDGLPAVSSVYKRSKSMTPNMIAGVDSTFESRLQHNTKFYTDATISISSLKMDEIATEDRLRWNKQDNRIYGLCYQHSHEYNMEFTDVDCVSNLKNLLATENIHKTKEHLVVAIGTVGDGGHITPLLSLPSCCKDETDQFPIMLDAVFKR